MISAGYLLETFLTLVIVCGVAFGVLYGARRLGLGRPSGPIDSITFISRSTATSARFSGIGTGT